MYPESFLEGASPHYSRWVSPSLFQGFSRERWMLLSDMSDRFREVDVTSKDSSRVGPPRRDDVVLALERYIETSGKDLDVTVKHETTVREFDTFRQTVTGSDGFSLPYDLLVAENNLTTFLKAQGKARQQASADRAVVRARGKGGWPCLSGRRRSGPPWAA